MKARSEGSFAREIVKLRASLHTQENTQDLALREQLISQGGDPEYWRELTPLDRRFAFRAFIRRVLVRDGNVLRIEFKI